MGAILKVVVLVVLRIIKLLIGGFGSLCLYLMRSGEVGRKIHYYYRTLVLYTSVLICDYQGQTTIADVSYRQTGFTTTLNTLHTCKNSHENKKFMEIKKKFSD